LREGTSSNTGTLSNDQSVSTLTSRPAAMASATSPSERNTNHGNLFEIKATARVS
jgi:hypothetical protein